MSRKGVRSRSTEILGHDAEITGHVGPKYAARAPQTNLTRQTPEDAMNVLMRQWARSDVPVAKQ
jgi:hypothetical protein